jgi:UDP-GlcNAc:undecaprenyl-phosphate GlcNAc-1-phosphate transferase
MKFDLSLLIEGRLIYLALISFFACAGLIILARFFPRLRGRSRDTDAVQSMHVTLTPRVGGIAIFGALAFTIMLAPESISGSYFYFIVATSVLFFVGLGEDLGFHISPRLRLLSAVIASMLVIVLLDVWMPRIGVPLIDPLLQYWIIGVPITLFVTVGVANGFNLIDGINGLAAMTAMIAAISMALIAQQAGYLHMVSLSMMLAAVIFGFLVLNYPFGLIFLGDAGAYTIGFVLSWFGISVLLNAPEVSPWAVLLTMFWPLADTLLALSRRRRRRMNAMQPDRLHVHQMVMRTLEIYILGRKRRSLSNPLTTLVLAPFVAAPPIIAVLFWDNNLGAFLAVIILLALFFGSYELSLKSVQHFRRR